MMFRHPSEIFTVTPRPVSKPASLSQQCGWRCVNIRWGLWFLKAGVADAEIADSETALYFG